MSDTIEPVEHPRNYEIPGWSNADAIDARDATIREQDAEIERLRADAERYRWLRENLGKWRIETYQTPVQSMVELHILGDSFFYNGDDLDRIIDGRRERT